jgi:hypothetical protein
MQRNAVKSSNVKSIGYDSSNEVLEVEFNGGGVYYYKDVPENVVSNVLNAPSIGKALNTLVKKNYEFVKGEWGPKEELPLNIYLAGGAGAGKTFAANYIINKYGFVQAKIAGPVYNIARDYFGMDKKDRTLLQVIGTDSGRDVVGRDIWVNRFIEDTRIAHVTRAKLGMPPVGLVCDDCRFVNEHEALKKAAWVGIYFDVPEETRIERLIKRDGDACVSRLQHPSEVDVLKFKDELIQFDATKSIEETIASLNVLIEKIKTEKEQVNG